MNLIERNILKLKITNNLLHIGIIITPTEYIICAIDNFFVDENNNEMLKFIPFDKNAINSKLSQDHIMETEILPVSILFRDVSNFIDKIEIEHLIENYEIIKKLNEHYIKSKKQTKK